LDLWLSALYPLILRSANSYFEGTLVLWYLNANLSLFIPRWISYHCRSARALLTLVSLSTQITQALLSRTQPRSCSRFRQLISLYPLFAYSCACWRLFTTIRRPVAFKAVHVLSSCQQPRNTKIATFRKSHQISTERPKLITSLCVIEKKQI